MRVMDQIIRLLGSCREAEGHLPSIAIGVDGVGSYGIIVISDFPAFRLCSFTI